MPVKVDLKNLEARLLEACNGSLDNPVNCLGLLNLSIPQMWLDQGCDLDRDVIPTLAAAGKKYHGKRIRDWNYFTGMIAEAKSRRERGMPAPNPEHPKFQPRKSARATKGRFSELVAAME